jgi:hypothetical protein
MGGVAVAHAFGLKGGEKGMAPRKGLFEIIGSFQSQLLNLHRVFLSEPLVVRRLERSEEYEQAQQRRPKGSALPESAKFRAAWKGGRPLHGGINVANFPNARGARGEKRM